jgi:hypothetical protein
MFCENCEALEETCCQAGKARRETAITLARIVTRQTEYIEQLKAERDAARLIAEDIMRLHAVAK